MKTIMLIFQWQNWRITRRSIYLPTVGTWLGMYFHSCLKASFIMINRPKKWSEADFWPFGNGHWTFNVVFSRLTGNLSYWRIWIQRVSQVSYRRGTWSNPSYSTTWCMGCNCKVSNTDIRRNLLARIVADSLIRGAVLSQLPQEASIVSTQATRYYWVSAMKICTNSDSGQEKQWDASYGRYRVWKVSCTWVYSKRVFLIIGYLDDLVYLLRRRHRQR